MTSLPAETFEISDADYENFKKLLKERNFSYDQMSSKVLKDFKEVLKFEGFADIVKDDIASIEKKLQSSHLDHSLTFFANDIKSLIADEIVTRYYGQRGNIIYNLRKDKDMKEGYDILKNTKRYRELLTPRK